MRLSRRQYHRLISRVVATLEKSLDICAVGISSKCLGNNAVWNHGARMKSRIIDSSILRVVISFSPGVKTVQLRFASTIIVKDSRADIEEYVVSDQTKSKVLILLGDTTYH